MISKTKELLLKVYSKIYNWDKKQVILIISSGRTGTNFMAHWFSLLSDRLFSVHEPNPDLFHLGVEKYRKKINITLNIMKYKRSLQLYKLNKSSKNIYIESNPNLVLLLPEVNELFKNLKIIFIKRNFDTYFLSAMNKSPDNSNINYFYGKPDSRERLTAIDYNDEQFRDEWDNFKREEKIAWWWKKSNKIISDYQENNKNSITVNFEDLFSKDNRMVLNKILDFLLIESINLSAENLAYFKNKKNTNELKRLKSFDELNNNLKDRLNKIIS